MRTNNNLSKKNVKNLIKITLKNDKIMEMVKRIYKIFNSNTFPIKKKQIKNKTRNAFIRKIVKYNVKDILMQRNNVV